MVERHGVKQTVRFMPIAICPNFRGAISLKTRTSGLNVVFLAFLAYAWPRVPSSENRIGSAAEIFCVAFLLLRVAYSAVPMVS